MRDSAYPLYRFLRSIRWKVHPTLLKGHYPENDDPVDEFILDQLWDAVELAAHGQPQSIAIAGHDHIYAAPVEQLAALGSRVLIVGFREEIAPALLKCEGPNCEVHDLEYDVQAFDVRLPRLYHPR